MLLRGDPDEITDSLRSMEKGRASIEKDIAGLVYYMNGGLNLVDAYNLSTEQMTTLTAIVNEHYERQNDAFSKSRKSR